MSAVSSHRHELITFVLFCLSIQAGVMVQAAESTVGQSIYLQGRGAEPATTYLVGPGIRAKTTHFACVQCHLEDGGGSREGGVSAPDIRFQHLTQAYPGLRATGRQHPAYDEESLARAIQQGTDPAGNPLHTAMPRYQFSAQDMQALISYLKQLDELTAPGVSDELIHIGTLQPSAGPLFQVSLDVRRLLHAFMQHINAQGGIYGRQLELVVTEFDPDSSASQISAVEALRDGNGVFCTLANLGLTPMGQAVQMLEAQRVPELAPLRAALEHDHNRDSHVFYLYASLADQATLLVDQWLSVIPDEKPIVAVVHADDNQALQAVRSIQQRLTGLGLVPAGAFSYQANDLELDSLMQNLQEVAADTILFLGGGKQLQRLFDKGDQIGWHPDVLALADLSGGVSATISSRQAQRLTMLTPFTLPAADSSDLTHFYNLLQQTGVFGQHRRIQLSAYTAARLLQEGLDRLGRNPTRNGLVASLNQLWKFETGATPPLTFNENRRTGARGGSIVAIDPVLRKFYRIREWQELQ